MNLEKLLIGKNDDVEANILLNMANRHGIITGASGTGKTTTVKVLAECFSEAGIPVFLADVKGDLAGFPFAGSESEKIENRLKELKIQDFKYDSFPTRFFDIYNKYGHPIRTTVENIGCNILAMMLGLSEAQEGNLNIIFKIAKDENLKLIDLKDLKLILNYVADNRNKYITKYGNITTQSIGVIQRSLLTLENQGLDNFFGEPSFNIYDFINTDNGKGFLNVLDARELFKNPDLYASFLLWLLNEIFNKLPEVGDVNKPKLVFFFDEAHILFNNIPNYRLKQICQVVKLIRSKGIGLYFISQSPNDIPNEILSQLSNKIQHGLRAYTPADEKAIKSIADTFRANEKFKTSEAILSLATGEAVVSFLNEKGEPGIVERVMILPPKSRMGTIEDSERNKIINESLLLGRYDTKIDNESAFEIISKKNQEEEKKRKEAEYAKELEKKKKEEEKKKKESNKKLKKFGNKAMNSVERRIINYAIKGIENGIKKFFK